MKTKIIHLPIWKLGHFNLLALKQKGKATAITETFYFDEDAKYSIGNDQGDWNKLIGLGELPLDHQKSSVMVGWRDYDGFFQFIPYLHDKDGTVSKEFEPIQFKKGWIEVELTNSNLKLHLTSAIDGSQQSKIWTFLGKNNLKKGPLYKITSWFGGNRIPNRKVTIYG